MTRERLKRGWCNKGRSFANIGIRYPNCFVERYMNMKRYLHLLIAFVICCLSVTSAVQAKFDPYVEDPAHDWGDINNPEPIWSSGALVGHLGRLDPADDVDAFVLGFDNPVNNWTFGAAVPVCANLYESVKLNMALIGPGL